MKKYTSIFYFLFLILLSHNVDAASPAGYIRKINIYGNLKTDKQAIINIIRVDSGEYVDESIHSKIEENLNNCGLFRDVRVEIRKVKENQVDLSVRVVEKTSFFIFPIFRAWSGRYSGGLILGESNLFGNNKRTLLVAEGGNKLSQFYAAYDDMALFNSDYTLRLETLVRFDKVPLYSGYQKMDEISIKDTGAVITPGYKWTDEISTRIAVDLKYLWFGNTTVIPVVSQNGFMFSLRFEFIYDSLKRKEAILRGTLLKALFEFSDKRMGSDYDYNKEVVEVENALQFLKYFNWRLLFQGELGRDLPFNEQFTLGGINLRGYNERQFRGDALLKLINEVTFPIYSQKTFALRGITFFDTGMTYFNSEGLDKHNFNNGTGGGFRVYLKKVVMPLMGLDFAYGIDNKNFGVYFYMGLTN